MNPSPELLAALLEAEPECVKTLDAAGRVLWMNAAGLALVGVAGLGEVVGRPAIDLVAPEDRAAFVAHLGRVSAGARDTLAFDLITLGGDRRHVESHATRATTADGTVYLSVTRDVTALRRSRDLYAKFVAATNDVAWDWDLTTNRLTWNDRIETVFGHRVEDSGDEFSFWERLIHPDDLPRLRLSLGRALRDPAQTLWTDEYRFRRSDGSYALVLDRGVIVREDGRAIRAVGVMIDVSAQRRLQAEVELSSRMASLGTLAAGVAHEINNPLAFVRANLDFALGRLANGPLDVRLALAQAREGSERVEAIVRDLKTFSRPADAGRGPIDVGRAIESAITLAWNEIRHRATLVRDLADGLAVVADEAQLGQVVLNLLINAAQALPDGGAAHQTITVEARRDGDEVVVVVADTGPGIPPDVAARIFEPFFTTKPVGVGTGLGLSICHRIVTSLGGAIDVDSAPGRGARVTVRLPACAPAEVPAAPPPGAASGARARVAVIDDEPLVGEALARLLDEHDVVVFERARDAMAWLDGGGRCDVLLCDLMMPETSGIEMHAWLRTAHPELATRTIFLTGGAFTDAAARFVRDHQARCFDKPFDLDVLRRAIAATLSE